MTVPGDIKTIPFDKLWYNAPFDEFLKVRVRITNGGVRRIGFHLKSTVGPDRIEIDPANGCLDPSETVCIFFISNKSIFFIFLDHIVGDSKPCQGGDNNSDRVTIEWTDSPASAPKKYSRDWFTGDSIVRRKNIALQYNE